ncbi:hypothetical protein SteCoe_12860 [Stentor coeruleus]|uniref:Bromo domain-containing protein n=1 Tax=Stentor coeruleus TaxID=5963 RepID=A0A1R2C9Q0_9CILI|nr:hypothetical protein SteCoe_12860 [Stentor coeruleus]
MEGKLELTREESKKLFEVIRQIEKKQEASDFLKPVDFKGLGLDDYPLIIKNPMDLSTVKKKLKSGKYATVSECTADLTLIWNNCRTYNQIGSTIVNQADILEAVMRKQCELNGILLDLPQKRQREETKPEPVKEILTLDSKIEFAEKVKKVSHEVLAELVRIVETDCKNALEELDNDRIQIKVDSLDKITFDKLLGLVTVVDEPKPTKKHKKNN